MGADVKSSNTWKRRYTILQHQIFVLLFSSDLWTPKLGGSSANTNASFAILIPCADADEVTGMDENAKTMPTTKATDNEAKVGGGGDNRGT